MTKQTGVVQSVKSSFNVAIVFVGAIVLGALALFGWKQYGGHFGSPVAQASTISNVVYPVSYTHLDVYKRQNKCNGILKA